MNNPLESFETAYNVASKGRKPLEGVMDAFDEEQKSKREDRTLKTKYSYDTKLEEDKAKYKSMYKSPEDEELNQAKTDYYTAMAGQKSGETLSPAQQIQKNKSIKEIFGVHNTNRIKRNQLTKAKSSLGRLPTGLIGKVQTEVMKRFDPNNPTMEDWQNVKSVLTDAQLMNVAKTKGAISDREMELFSQAAANDDLASVARMKPVLDRLGAFLDSEENSLMDSYATSYGEDPRDWFQGSEDNTPDVSSTNASDPKSSFLAKAKSRGWV